MTEIEMSSIKRLLRKHRIQLNPLKVRFNPVVYTSDLIRPCRCNNPGSTLVCHKKNRYTYAITKTLRGCHHVFTVTDNSIKQRRFNPNDPTELLNNTYYYPHPHGNKCTNACCEDCNPVYGKFNPRKSPRVPVTIVVGSPPNTYEVVREAHSVLDSVRARLNSRVSSSTAASPPLAAVPPVHVPEDPFLLSPLPKGFLRSDHFSPSYLRRTSISTHLCRTSSPIFPAPASSDAFSSSSSPAAFFASGV